MSSDNTTNDFRHDNDKLFSAWNQQKVVSWNNHNNMGDAHKRVCKITDVTWGKCSHFRKQAVEDSQLNCCVVGEVTQQMGYAKVTFSTHVSVA